MLKRNCDLWFCYSYLVCSCILFWQGWKTKYINISNTVSSCDMFLWSIVIVNINIIIEFLFHWPSDQYYLIFKVNSEISLILILDYLPLSEESLPSRIGMLKNTYYIVFPDFHFCTHIFVLLPRRENNSGMGMSDSNSRRIWPHLESCWIQQRNNHMSFYSTMSFHQIKIWNNIFKVYKLNFLFSEKSGFGGLASFRTPQNITKHPISLKTVPNWPWWTNGHWSMYKCF